MKSTLRSSISDSYEGIKYCSTFIFMNINLPYFHSPYYMLRQIMVFIITPLGPAQTYNKGVTSVFIMTGINTHNNNNNNSNMVCYTRTR